MGRRYGLKIRWPQGHAGSSPARGTTLHVLWPGAILMSLLIAGVGQADDASSPTSKPLNLLLTREELRAVVRNYEVRTGEDLTGPINEDEVIVRAPAVLAPMRDESRDAWGGIAAPFWAIMHPKDAWRIFVPVPSKGPPQESERPAPDPR